MITDYRSTTPNLTSDEARILTDRIKGAAETMCALLLRAYEGRAWRALGYPSWRDYAKTEFRIGQSHAYRLLDHGRVVRALQAAAGDSPIGEISEHQARQIKPHLTIVTDDIEAEIEAGVEPQAAVRKAVEAVTEARPSDNFTADDVIERRCYYAGSSKRIDRANRFVQITIWQAVNLFDQETIDLADIDFDQLDRTCIPSWINDLEQAHRGLKAFTARLKKAVQS